jgi:hypothetical protein
MALAHELGLRGVVYATTPGKGLSKAISFPRDVMRAAIRLRSYRPDLVLDFGIYGVLAGKLLNAPSVVFTDSEPSINWMQGFQYRAFMPFVDRVVTPSSFRDDLGHKHVRVDSLKEIAYLHPNYYVPDDDVLGLLGVELGERYALIRFNDLSGVHNMKLNSFTLTKKVELVEALEHAGVRVFISFEGQVPKELEQYRLNTPKNRIHDVLCFADFLVTDTQTMATEAAILGTPVVRCNTFVGKKDMGNFIMLEKYGLMHNYSNPDDAVKKTLELIANKDLKLLTKKHKTEFLNNVIDITKYMIKLIEKYE